MDANPLSNPCQTGFHLVPATEIEKEQFKQLNVNYQLPIGLLNFTATLACPDISYSVSKLARFLDNPGILHWREVIQFWLYLLKKIDYKLTFKSKCESNHLITYSDATCGDNPNTRLSQTGFITLFKGSPLYWTSQPQRSIAHSSTKSECNALSTSHLEARWLNHLISEVLQTTFDPHLHLIDNKGLNDIIKKFGTKSHAKYIKIKMKSLRNDLHSKLIQIELILSQDMLADPLTKAASAMSV